jgi:hypothetical protein
MRASKQGEYMASGISQEKPDTEWLREEYRVLSGHYLLDHLNYIILKGVIQAGRSLGELCFIEGNVRHALIERFANFYRSRDRDKADRFLHFADGAYAERK